MKTNKFNKKSNKEVEQEVPENGRRDSVNRFITPNVIVTSFFTI